MRDLNFELKNLAEAHSKDIGATSLRDRRYALGRMATLLEGELGYRGLQAANLKGRTAVSAGRTGRAEVACRPFVRAQW